MAVLHATFTLERTYPADADRVFAAWSDPASKARWFAGPDATHELDFRVGGLERVTTAELRLESTYADIVEGERIVYTSTMHADGRLATVSLTTVRFEPAGSGTRLLLTEQGTYLDGHEEPAWRERGTSDWLDSLATELKAS